MGGDETGEPVLGSYEPTFLWVPPHESTLGGEVIDLAASAGLILDPAQQLVINGGFAVDSQYRWLLFEVAQILSRQNGKDGTFEAAELAWLFLFGEQLIIHSAHLFETSREHFLRIKARIDNYDHLRRRVRRMREGRGSEEIELLTGERLKFMTRKGGAGRGFTANKLIMNEAMYLDAMMMAAGLPTMATIENAQVWYGGSAGMRHSTQLALVRRRGYACDDPALMLAEWAIDPRPVEEGGDDRSLPQTWAKVNPALGAPAPGRRITVEYVEKEAAALGGYDSPAFGMERLGVGDWPEDDEAWDVISEQTWLDAARPDVDIVEGMTVCFAGDTDPVRKVTTIAACARLRSGQLVVQAVERHRGTAWVVDWLVEYSEQWTVCATVILRNGALAMVIDEARRRKLHIESPSKIEYAQACGRFTQGIEGGATVHVAQAMVNRCVAGARKIENPEGGWVWSRSSPVDVAPVVAPTLAAWGLERFEHAMREPWALSLNDVAPPPRELAIAGRGAAGFAASRAGRP